MDVNKDCLWKNKDCPEKCLNVKNKSKICHCNLEPCSLYEKRTLFKILFRRNKNV